MARDPLPPTAVVISFIDCINRGDVDGLGALMTDDHALTVFDEEPLVGSSANVDAWRGYFSAFPTYVIHPQAIAADGRDVAVLGTTTGSHLGLPDDEELQRTLIWLADVEGGAVRSWQLVEDTRASRARLHLPPQGA